MNHSVTQTPPQTRTIRSAKSYPKGTLSKPEVHVRAEKIFKDFGELNAWDRRRILQVLEKLHKAA